MFMGKKALFGIGDLVTAAVLGTREQRNAEGNVIFSRDAQNREIPQIEEFPLVAPFDGRIVQVHSREEGDGSAYHAYDVTCPHNDRAGSMWVEEKYLVATPTKG
jgi:hypothetical protein